MNKRKKTGKNYTWTTVLSRSKEMAGRNDHVITHQRGYHFTSPELFCFIHGIFPSKYRLISNERETNSYRNVKVMQLLSCLNSLGSLFLSDDRNSHHSFPLVAKFTEKPEGC